MCQKVGQAANFSRREVFFFAFGALVPVPSSRCTANGRVQLKAQCLVCRVICQDVTLFICFPSCEVFSLCQGWDGSNSLCLGSCHGFGVTIFKSVCQYGKIC